MNELFGNLTRKNQENTIKSIIEEIIPPSDKIEVSEGTFKLVQEEFGEMLKDLKLPDNMISIGLLTGLGILFLKLRSKQFNYIFKTLSPTHINYVFSWFEDANLHKINTDTDTYNAELFEEIPCIGIIKKIYPILNDSSYNTFFGLGIKMSYLVVQELINEHEALTNVTTDNIIPEEPKKDYILLDKHKKEAKQEITPEDNSYPTTTKLSYVDSPITSIITTLQKYNHNSWKIQNSTEPGYFILILGTPISIKTLNEILKNLIDLYDDVHHRTINSNTNFLEIKIPY
jgi:hypothetical protein